MEFGVGVGSRGFEWPDLASLSSGSDNDIPPKEVKSFFNLLQSCKIHKSLVFTSVESLLFGWLFPSNLFSFIASFLFFSKNPFCMASSTWILGIEQLLKSAEGFDYQELHELELKVLDYHPHLVFLSGPSYHLCGLGPLSFQVSFTS